MTFGAEPEIVYVAHPVGNSIQANADRVVRWLDWLMKYETEATFLCPWLPYVHVWLRRYGDVRDTNHPFRVRAMRDNLIAAELCTGIVLVGGEITNGMYTELGVVTAPKRTPRRTWAADLTHLGPEPPSDEAWCGSPLWVGQAQWSKSGRIPCV